MSDNQVRYCRECKQRESGWSMWLYWICEECRNKILEELYKLTDNNKEKDQDNEQ